jgi:agmatine deiminase
MRIVNIIILTVLFISLVAYNNDINNEPTVTTTIRYTFPEESEAHEGTWLQWPHHYQYGKKFRDYLDPTWVEMTKELISSENVHIIAYNNTEKNRIISLLNAQSVDLANVNFKTYPNDDFWIRDNGPIYVRNQTGSLVIQDWGFNGWGEKSNFKHCNSIPQKIGQDQNLTIVDLNHIMINEGGSVELDGKGTLMACKSSILNSNRNPGMTLKEAEEIFTEYLGATHFVWLDGQAGLEITDQHIDGFARFGNAKTIVTMKTNDLLDYDVKQSDIDKLYAAKNSNGELYLFLKLPLTKKNVITTYGKNLGYKGSYCNYYIANTKVLVPTYNDPNDSTAIQLLQTLYPTKTVTGIDFRNVYANGGMIHCVTQQQHKE